MMKLDWESVRVFASKTCKILTKILAVGFTVAPFVVEAETENDNTETAAGYGDAVRAIIKSDMNDFYKRQAISYLKRDGDGSFYEAIKVIAEDSDMNDFYKCNLIWDLSNE